MEVIFLTRQKKQLLIVTLLTVLLLIFIWGNSFLPREISSRLSNWLYRVLLGNRAAEVTRADSGLTEGILRKLMHATEFLTLGVLLSFYPQILNKRTLAVFGFCLLCGLFAASTDEFIQIFNDRYPSIRDVGIDFTGFSVGTLLVWGVSILIRRKKNI